jgi:hypothetical protein
MVAMLRNVPTRQLQRGTDADEERACVLLLLFFSDVVDGHRGGNFYAEREGWVRPIGGW